MPPATSSIGHARSPPHLLGLPHAPAREYPAEDRARLGRRWPRPRSARPRFPRVSSNRLAEFALMRISGRRLGLALILGALGIPVTVSGQSDVCTDGAIGRIEIANHSIFAPSEIEGRSREWAYRTVNGAHYRTRESFIRRRILVSEGDCYDPLMVSESGRVLRELRFMARATADAERQEDGSWVVRFETWDEWTTLISLNASVEDSFELEGIYLEEKNLLGRGGQAVIEYHRLREVRDLGLRLLTRRFLGTLATAHVLGGKSRLGYFFRPGIDYPFRGETGSFSFNAELRLHNGHRSYYTGDRNGASHLLVPVTERLFEGLVAWRFGDAGNRRTLGLELGASRPTPFGTPTIASRNSYEDLVTAPDSLVAGLGRQSQLLSSVRLGVTAGIRRIRFETRDGLDLLFGVQDVAIGSEVELTVGRTLKTWGSRELGTYARFEAFAGTAGSWLVAQSWMEARGQLLDQVDPGQGRGRDLFVSGQAIGYVRPSFLADHTLIARVGVTGAWGYDDRLQLSLGGAGEVRSYVDYELPVSRRVVGRLEERWRIPNLPPALDLGLSVFGDVGRGWGGDLAFSRDTGWLGAVGGGIRLALPARSGHVFRIEMAWPVHGGGEAVFRVVKESGRTGR